MEILVYFLSGIKLILKKVSFFFNEVKIRPGLIFQFKETIFVLSKLYNFVPFGCFIFKLLI